MSAEFLERELVGPYKFKQHQVGLRASKSLTHSRSSAGKSWYLVQVCDVAQALMRHTQTQAAPGGLCSSRQAGSMVSRGTMQQGWRLHPLIMDGKGAVRYWLGLSRALHTPFFTLPAGLVCVCRYVEIQADSDPSSVSVGLAPA